MMQGRDHQSNTTDTGVSLWMVNPATKLLHRAFTQALSEQSGESEGRDSGLQARGRGGRQVEFLCCANVVHAPRFQSEPYACMR